MVIACMVPRDPTGRARRRPAQTIRRGSPLAMADRAGADDEQAGERGTSGRAWMSTTAPATASDSGAATTEPSIRKLIVRPSMSGSVRPWTQAMTTMLT